MIGSTKPTSSLLAGVLLIAGWLVGMGQLAPADAHAQQPAGAEVPAYDPERPSDPLFPWTPTEQLYDWLEITRTWNLFYRGGRFQVGLVSNFSTFTTVASDDTTMPDPPDEMDPDWRDPDIHMADLIDTHLTLQFGFTVVEQLRMRLGVGASLTQIKTNDEFEPHVTVHNEEYRRYGWGFNALVGLEWAPVFTFMPDWMQPVFEFDMLAWTGKNGDGYGTLNATLIRLSYKQFFELVNNPREGVSFSLYLGAGYNHYAGYIDLPGRTQEFSSPRGGGAEYPFGDVDLLAGMLFMFNDNFAIRIEGASGTPTVRLTLEVIGE